MKRPIEIERDPAFPQQGGVAILFRNVSHSDCMAQLNITAPLTEDCGCKGPTRIEVYGRQTESGFEIKLGQDAVSALQPGFSLRLTVEGTDINEEFLWLGDAPQPQQPLRRVDQSAPLNHDLLSEQLRVFAMAKDAALSAKINETAPGKLGFGESRTSLNPAKSRVPGNVAIALIAFLAGAAVSSMVWLNDWKLSQTESPPPTAVALFGPGESEKQEPRLAAADDPCAPGCMPQAGLDATLPRESLLSTHSEHSNDSGSGTGLSESFEGPTADGSKAPLPVSFARYIPEGGEQLALPPLPPEKPKAQKHAAAKSHPKSAVIPPRRPQMQSASLFSQVSDYLARILPKL